jgi:hypothetical protein
MVFVGDEHRHSNNCTDNSDRGSSPAESSDALPIDRHRPVGHNGPNKDRPIKKKRHLPSPSATEIDPDFCFSSSLFFFIQNFYVSIDSININISSGCPCKTALVHASRGVDGESAGEDDILVHRNQIFILSPVWSGESSSE